MDLEKKYAIIDKRNNPLHFTLHYFPKDGIILKQACAEQHIQRGWAMLKPPELGMDLDAHKIEYAKLSGKEYDEKLNWLYQKQEELFQRYHFDGTSTSPHNPPKFIALFMVIVSFLSTEIALVSLQKHNKILKLKSAHDAEQERIKAIMAEDEKNRGGQEAVVRNSGYQ